MSHAEGEEVELFTAPDKRGVLLACTADICRFPSGEALIHDAESCDFS